MQYVLPVCLLLSGLIHLMPASGLFSEARLTTLYAVDLTDSNTLLLMRHRAALFSIIGVVLVVSAYQPKLYLLGALIGLASMVSFIFLTLLEPNLNSQLSRVAIVDCVLSLAMAVALMVHFGKQF